jgi:methionine-rich copper-binding protein CopC
MKMRLFSLKMVVAVLASGAACLTAGAAWAHAALDHASPGVGATVQAPPAELQLTFTQSVTPAFSGAKLTTATGAAVPTGKASVDGGGHVLHVPIGQKLAPGTYEVDWRATSVDTHVSSGRYKFTVAP